MKYFEAHPVTEFKDENGNVPEILIVDGNRTGGKTTAFSRLLVDEFISAKKKFFLVYRYKNDMKDVADAFFKDIKTLFFPEYDMTARSHANGAFFELFLNKESCGYCSSLTMVSKLKRYSHLFSDVQNMFFDEYQDENGLYLPEEVKKLVSLHTTIARGQGQAVRFVPLYMASNSISIFNPYYIALGITSKINSRTKVLRGTGFVLLRLIIKDVAEAQKASAFNQAFAESDYLKSSIDNSFLNDDAFNVERMNFSGKPIFGFYCAKTYYTVYSSSEAYYVKKGGDQNIKPRFGVNQSDRGKDVLSIITTSYYSKLRIEYENATVFFETQEAKHAFQMLIMQ